MCISGTEKQLLLLLLNIYIFKYTKGRCGGLVFTVFCKSR